MNLEELYIPAGMTFEENNGIEKAFAGCSNLKVIYTGAVDEDAARTQLEKLIDGINGQIGNDVTYVEYGTSGWENSVGQNQLVIVYNYK